MAELKGKGRRVRKDKETENVLDDRHEFPREITEGLYPHQADGVRWLWKLHCTGSGGIVADDMGLGKTRMICCHIKGLFNCNMAKWAMVVVPKSLVPHWIKEFSSVDFRETVNQYSGSMHCRNLKAVIQGKGVIVTTYTCIIYNAEALSKVKWDCLFLDEAHEVKNIKSAKATRLLEIPCDIRTAVTGTPIQNNLNELWCLFKICRPKLFGDWQTFRGEYVRYISRGLDKNATNPEKRLGIKVATELRETIKPYFLRRMKSDVFCKDKIPNAPEKHDIIVWLRLTTCQRKMYRCFLERMHHSKLGGSPLAAMTVMIDICNHPDMLKDYDEADVSERLTNAAEFVEELGVVENTKAQKSRSPKSKDDKKSPGKMMAKHINHVCQKLNCEKKNENDSCKLSFILSLLDALIPEGHNVLVFSQSLKMLNFIQESLVSKPYDFARIDGQVKPEDRTKIVDDFQHGIGGPILLLSSKVGGLGLTLTKADRVIIVDPAWNPSVDNQSVDRAYRIGQENDVVVYRLVTCGTVEEKMYQKQVLKAGLFKATTEKKHNVRYFSQMESQEVFKPPKLGYDFSDTQRRLHSDDGNPKSIDENLKNHVEFLKTLNIAGVSYHSLLYSKIAPTLMGEEEPERLKTAIRNKKSTYNGEADWAVHAKNPKDWKSSLDNLQDNNKEGSRLKELIEQRDALEDEMKQYQKLLANKDLVRTTDAKKSIVDKIRELLMQLGGIQGAIEYIKGKSKCDLHTSLRKKMDNGQS
ncbi:protein CHROMATIN REMODELING 24-like [Cornus florida]|uniref:protein CHROMATIN REMODELING 24-like n=1 Tax=Cornus florida TaxID=4283 RepID=UPI0028A03781|nr:protein CHROMATIN REMODELING 24-like [Cornus florida]XP_059648473.1 protein CHROMATIN REMODELING 24-like [Cornus florida]